MVATKTPPVLVVQFLSRRWTKPQDTSCALSLLCRLASPTSRTNSLFFSSHPHSRVSASLHLSKNTQRHFSEYHHQRRHHPEPNDEAHIGGRRRSKKHIAASGDDQSATALEIKKGYMRSFYRKVHPDFFHNLPDMRKVNEESLQQLNSLIDMSLDAAVDAFQHNKRPIELRFYVKEGNNYKEIKVTATIPSLQISPTTSREISSSKYQRFLDAVLFELYQQSKVAIAPNHVSLFKRVSEEDGRRSSEVDERGMTEEERIRRKATKGGSGRQNEAQWQMAEDDFVVKGEVMAEKTMSPSDLLKARCQILFSFQKRFMLFSDELTEFEKYVGVVHLEENLHKLSYPSWHSIPIFLMPPESDPTACPIKGVVPVPCLFNPSSFSKFLSSNLSSILSQRKSFDQTVQSIHTRAEKLRKQLKASSITFSRRKKGTALSSEEIILEEVTTFQNVVNDLGSRLDFFDFEDVTISLSSASREDNHPEVLTERCKEGTANEGFEWDEESGTVHIPRLSSLGDGEQRLNRVEDALKCLKFLVDEWRDKAAMSASHLRKLFDRVESLQHQLGVPVRISTEIRGDKRKQLEGLDNLLKTVERYPSITGLSTTSLTLVLGDSSGGTTGDIKSIDEANHYSVNLSKRVLKIPCDFDYPKLVEFLKRKVLLPLSSTSAPHRTILPSNGNEEPSRAQLDP